MGLSGLPAVTTIAEGEAGHIKTGSSSPLSLVAEVQVITLKRSECWRENRRQMLRSASKNRTHAEERRFHTCWAANLSIH